MSAHTITLTERDISLIANLLAEQPYKVSAETMARLQEQVAVSQRRADEREEQQIRQRILDEERKKAAKSEQPTEPGA